MSDSRMVEERLRHFLSSPDDGDWLEVLRRADAIPRKRPVASRRRRLAPLVAAAVVAAAVAVLLISPWSGGGGLVQRALAAIGTGPVLHAVVEPKPGGGFDWYEAGSLPSGTPIEVNIRQEIWFDQSRDLEKMVTTVNGRMVSQVLETPDGNFHSQGPVELYTQNGQNGTKASGPPPALALALTGFIDRYKSDLASGQATQTGAGQIDGHNVIWLRIEDQGQNNYPAEDVAIDASTYAPVFVRTLDTNSVQFGVTEIDTQTYDPSIFMPPAH